MRFTAFLQNGMPKKTRKSRPWAEKSTHSCRLLVVRTASPRSYAVPKSPQLCDDFKKLHFLIAPTAEKIFVHFSLKCRACQPGPLSRALQHRTFCSRLKNLVHRCKKKRAIDSSGLSARRPNTPFSARSGQKLVFI